MTTFFRYFLAALLAIFAFIVIVILFFVIAASFTGAGDVVDIDDQSILHLTFENEITDRHYDKKINFDLNSFQPKKKDGLNNILKQIRKAKVDEEIEGIFIDSRTLKCGLATMQEIRDALVDFKSEGKWIVSYSDVFSQGAYYLASCADEIYIQPEGMLELRGLKADITFMRTLLDKVGVEMQVIRPTNNKFKSAVEPFILDSMSVANEEQITKILTSIWDRMAEDVSSSLEMSREELETAVEELKSRSPKSAVEAGLVTATLYRDEVMELLKDKIEIDEEDEMPLVQLGTYSSVKVKDFKDPSTKYSKDKLAVIYATGAIDIGEGDDESIGSDALAEQISIARKDSSIKAIVLRVNSPGGSALASDEIWREMSIAKESKPVVVSMGDVAASGGYYISCSADKIYASETTITGSIGVFGLIPNTEDLNEDILGLHHDGVKTHRFSDIMEMHRPLRSDEREIWQGLVDEIYVEFTGKVATAREMEREAVDEIAQGRVWTGIDAHELGLVDELGGLEEAIAFAAEMAELDEYRIKNLPEEKDPIEQIIGELTGQAKANVLETVQMEEPHLYQMVKQYREVMKMRGVQARMPYNLFIY